LSRSRPDDMQGRTIILSAANYDRRKGFEDLVAAFARICRAHPAAVLVMVCNASESLREQVGAAGLGSQVRILPLMSQEELKQWMVWADLFAMPSWSEAFGLVYVESLMCGTPVLMSSDCGLAPQLGLVVRDPEPEQHGWVVAPQNVASIAAALDDALLHPSRLVQMGRSGRKFVQGRYTWRENAKQLLIALGEHASYFHEPMVLRNHPV